MWNLATPDWQCRSYLWEREDFPHCTGKTIITTINDNEGERCRTHNGSARSRYIFLTASEREHLRNCIFSWINELFVSSQYSLEQCRATVVEALRRGVNYIDTAPWYGQGVSEEILGKVGFIYPTKYVRSKNNR